MADSLDAFLEKHSHVGSPRAQPDAHAARRQTAPKAPVQTRAKAGAPAQKGFVERLRDWFFPLYAVPPAHRREALSKEHPLENEFWQGVTFGYGPDIARHIVAAIGGDKPGKEAERLERKAIGDYRARHPLLAGAANLAGNIASTAVGGELLGAGAEATGISSKLAPLASKVGRVARAAAPVAATAGALAGGYEGAEHGTPVSAPGLASTAEGALAGGAAGYLLPRHLAETAIGAGLGALQGSGEAGPGHRAQGAGIGGLLGGATGFLLPGAMRTAGNAVSSAFGSPERTAARRLAAAARDDTEFTREATATEQARRAGLGLDPAKGYQAAGDNTRALLRVAGRHAGKGRGLARAEAEGVGEQLPFDLRAQGERIAPHTDRTTEQQIEHLTQQQSSRAAAQYREPYAARIPLDERAVELLDNREMRAAMDTARRVQETRVDDPEAAQIVRDIDSIKRFYTELDAYHAAHAEWTAQGGMQMPELSKTQRASLEALGPTAQRQALEQLGAKPIPEPQAPTPPEVSAGALDRIKIAAARRSEALKNVPGQEPKRTHDLGVAVGQRVKAVDDYLDGLEHLKAARADYKHYADRIGALREAEANITSMKPKNFVAWVKGLPDEAKGDLRIALRDVITGKGKDVISSTAMLRGLDTNANLRDNIKTLMGDQDAQKLFDAAETLRENKQQADFIAGHGSPTAMNIEDKQAAEHLLKGLSVGGLIHQHLKDLLANANTLSKEEAHALVNFALGDPHAILDAIEANPEGTLGRAIRMGIARSAATVGAQGVGGGDDLVPTTPAASPMLEEAQKRYQMVPVSPAAPVTPPAPTGAPLDAFGDPVGSKTPPAPAGAPAASVGTPPAPVGARVDAFGDPVQ